MEIGQQPRTPATLSADEGGGWIGPTGGLHAMAKGKIFAPAGNRIRTSV